MARKQHWEAALDVVAQWSIWDVTPINQSVAHSIMSVPPSITWQWARAVYVRVGLSLTEIARQLPLFLHST